MVFVFLLLGVNECSGNNEKVDAVEEGHRPLWRFSEKWEMRACRMTASLIDLFSSSFFSFFFCVRCGKRKLETHRLFFILLFSTSASVVVAFDSTRWSVQLGHRDYIHGCTGQGRLRVELLAGLPLQPVQC